MTAPEATPDGIDLFRISCGHPFAVIRTGSYMRGFQFDEGKPFLRISIPV